MLFHKETKSIVLWSKGTFSLDQVIIKREISNEILLFWRTDTTLKTSFRKAGCNRLVYNSTEKTQSSFGFLECLKSDNVLFKKHRSLLGMNKGTIYNCQSCSFPAASRSCELFYTPFEIDKMFFFTTKIWFKLKCYKMFCKI